MAEITVNGLRFELFKRTNTARVKNIAQGFKNQSTFDIPETVTSEGIKFRVTEIGEKAFSHCYISSITIPNSVTSIGNEAFYFSHMSSIAIPNSVTSIGMRAFAYTDLTSIIVAEDNKFYDSRENCNAIIHTASNTLICGCRNTTIPNSVTSIGAIAFYDCKALTSITIPNSVTSIGKYAFDGCKSLTSITIPNSVTSIGSNAFNGCKSLTAIMVDANNMVYDSRENCNAIIHTASNTLICGCRNTTIPNSVTSIGEYAFYDCKALTSITIPDSVTSIGEYAFKYCESLTSITIPDSVTSIGYSAFEDCDALTSITIPNSVTHIGNHAFSLCNKLTSVTIENEKGKVKIENYAFPYSAKINYVGKPKEQPAKPIENPYHQAILEVEKATEQATATKAAEKTTVNVETTPEPSLPVLPTTTQTRNRDKADYVFNGKVYTKKVQLVHDLVLHHLSLHPDLTHEQLKKDFQVQKNMDVMFMSYEMYLSTLAEKGIVYFFESKTEEDTIALQDAKILISSNWPTMVGGKPSVFAKLLDKAKELGYEITVQE